MSKLLFEIIFLIYLQKQAQVQEVQGTESQAGTCPHSGLFPQSVSIDQFEFILSFPSSRTVFSPSPAARASPS